MAKKLSLLLASIAAFVFAVPALASAAPEITDPGGTTVAPGALLEATNITAADTTTSLGKFTCKAMTITMEVNTNGASTFQLVGKGQGTSSSCSIGGKPSTNTDFTLTLLHSATVGSGTINLTFISHVLNVTCHFASPNMPFTYTSGGDTIKITNGDLKGTPAACEPALFNAEFTIETEGGGSVILD